MREKIAEIVCPSASMGRKCSECDIICHWKWELDKLEALFTAESSKEVDSVVGKYDDFMSKSNDLFIDAQKQLEQMREALQEASDLLLELQARQTSELYDKIQGLLE